MLRQTHERMICRSCLVHVERIVLLYVPQGSCLALKHVLHAIARMISCVNAGHRQRDSAGWREYATRKLHNAGCRSLNVWYPCVIFKISSR